MSAKEQKAKTVAVHAGARPLTTRSHPVVPSIHVSAVSYFDSCDDLELALDGKDYSYSRISAPNTELLEEAIAALEGAEACVAYGSGMAALKAVFEAQGFKPGDRLLMPGDGYGVTLRLYKQLCARFGVELHTAQMSKPGALERIAAVKPKLVLAESVTNPLLSVPDIRKLAKAAHEVGAAFVVDATFPSPHGQRALALGGAVSGSRERMAELRSNRLVGGEVIGPFEAWLTLRGIRTLAVRMKAHNEHALHVAKRLAESPLLERVYYPGLPSHADHAVAKEVLTNGFGGMVAFEIKGAGRPEGFRFLESVRLARPGPSLGDVCTLVMHAASASARRMTPEEREAAGIKESLIRVSVGLEDPDDIADDLLAAVAEAVKRP